MTTRSSPMPRRPIEDSARPLAEGIISTYQDIVPTDPEEGRRQRDRPHCRRVRAVQQGSRAEGPDRRGRRGQQAHPVTGERILERVMLAFEGRGGPGLGRTPAGRGARRRGDAVHGGQRDAAGAGAGVDRGVAAGGRGPGDGRRQPLLIAADQEGGQLNALGSEATQFAGNMALGAVDDEALTERVGAAIGREARALGVNVVYAPSVDLASEPGNSSLGHPLVRRRPGRGRPSWGGDGPRPPVDRGGRLGEALPGSWRAGRGHSPRARRRAGERRPPGRPRVRPVPGGHRGRGQAR